MKIIKPITLGMLYKPFSMHGKNQLCVMAMGFFKLTQPKTRFSIGPEAFASIVPQLPAGQPIDMVMPKSESEFVVCGHAYAPKSHDERVNDKRAEDKVSATTQMDVAVELGSLRKTVRVYGDRNWYYGNLSAFKVSPPKPFTKISLGYERAFGSAEYPFNTLGSGYNASGMSFLYGQRDAPMPNLEYPLQPILGHKKHYSPASFGPMDMMWQQRAQHNGTYDQKWLETRFPGLADDTDMRLYNVAAEDQRQKQRWSGGEAYRLHGMHPEHEDICGNLPNFRIRGLLKIAKDHRTEESLPQDNKEQDNQEYRFLDFNCDTVWFFPDTDIGVMLYRTVTPINHPDGLDAKTLMLAYENPEEPEKSEAHYIEQLEARTDRQRAAVYALNDAALIPTQPKYVRIAREKAKQAKKEAEEAKVQNIIAELEKAMDIPEHLPEPSEKKEAESPSFEMPEELSSPMTMEDIADGGVDLSDALAQLDEQREKMQTHMDTEIANNQKQMDDLFAELSDQQDMKDEPQDGLDKLDTEHQERLWQEIQERVDYLPIDLHPQQGSHSSGVEQLIELLESDDSTKDSSKEEEEYKNTDFSEFEKMQRTASRAQTQLNPDRKSLPVFVAKKLGHWLIDAINTKQPLAGRDLSDVFAPAINLSGLDLREVNFTGANLTKAKFENSDLQGANFLGAVLNGASFRGANLQDANLSQSQAHKCNFDQAMLISAQLVEANLRESHFRQADLSKAILTKAHLNFSNLSQSTLIQTLMTEIQADHSLWLEADMSQAVFAKAQLCEANFSKAKINRVIFSDINARASIWYEVDALRSFFGSADLRQSQWRDAELKTCGFRQANLSESDGRKATFYQSDFGDARIQSADWSESVLCSSLFSETRFFNSKLIAADFNQAICRGTNFTEADLSKAILVSADLSHAIFLNTCLHDVLESVA